MSVDTTMAVLYAQSGLSNMANLAAVAPQASLAMSRVLAAEQMREERQKVENNEKTEKSNINPDREGGRGFFHSRMRSRRDVDAEDHEDLAPVSALVGNLLNVKV